MTTGIINKCGEKNIVISIIYQQINMQSCVLIHYIVVKNLTYVPDVKNA